MIHYPDYPSIAKFQQFVELKDCRPLAHVLPKGFQRVRHFGWLSPAARQRWQRLQALLDWKPAELPDAAAPPSWAPCCPRCQQLMRPLGSFARSGGT